MSAGNHVSGADEIPYDVRAVLPADPFEQLDLARKLAALAFKNRLSGLENSYGDSQGTVQALQARVGQLESALKDAGNKLSLALEEQTKLAGEKSALVATVKKLNRDVAKLEAFKRTLMQQLQDDQPNEDGAVTPPASIAGHGEGPVEPAEALEEQQVQPERGASMGSSMFGASPSASAQSVGGGGSAAGAYITEDDGASALAAVSAALPNPALPRIVTNAMRASAAAGGANLEAPSGSTGLAASHAAAGQSPSSSSTSYSRSNSLPQQPQQLRESFSSDEGAEAAAASAAAQQQQQQQHLQQQQINNVTHPHRMPRGSRTPSLRTPSLTPQFSPHLTPSATPPVGSASGSPRHGKAPRVDGKEFFRQARSRLSYEQFSSFLANIKELNAHRQTREETLRKADDIFGPDNKDLFLAFDGLLSRHLPS